MPYSRRNFLKTTASVTLLPAVHEQILPVKNMEIKAGFSLMIMQTNWGFAGTLDGFCRAAKKEGYDGVELWWPGEDAKLQKELFDAVNAYGLEIGFLCAGHENDARQHLNTFIKNVSAATANVFRKPVYINCHSGRDHFSYEQNKLLIDYTEQRTKETGIPIYHETHRSRMMFAAHVTRNFLEKHPGCKLTFDVSHWCNVHESLLADQDDTLDIVLSRVEHIHARIGHQEGPQVNDPRAPEWADAVKAHLGWWDKVVARKKKAGERLTILTEFGPPDYLPALPYTRQPVADQWAINVYMMKLLRERYGK
jgi:sugar phosphate isomerase/epimerase